MAIRRAILVAAVSLLLGASVSGQCRYDVTLIAAPDCPPYGAPPTIGLGLSEAGAVVGYFQSCVIGPDKPFLWTRHRGFQPLPLPLGVSAAYPNDVNDQLQIVGMMGGVSSPRRAFLYETGKYTILPPVHDTSAARSSAAAINEAGVVVGSRSIEDSAFPQNGFVWSLGRGFEDLGLMDGPSTCAIDINDAGVVVGSVGYFLSDEAFLRDGGEVHVIGPIPGGLSSTSAAINSMNEIAGVGGLRSKGDGATVTRAFSWRDTRFSILEPPSGYDTSTTRDINDLGQVVGFSQRLDNPNDRVAVLWQNGSPITLNDLLPASVSATVHRALAINNTGQIVAEGSYRSNCITLLFSPIDASPTDLDGDCITTHFDLSILLENWGRSNHPADVNGDGVIGFLDLLLLLLNWG